MVGLGFWLMVVPVTAVLRMLVVVRMLCTMTMVCASVLGMLALFVIRLAGLGRTRIFPSVVGVPTLFIH